MKDKFKVTSCSICLNGELEPVITLPDSPIADEFNMDMNDSLNAQRYPLVVNYCCKCGHLQLSHHLPTHRLFKNYTYRSANNLSLVKHFETYSQNLIDKFSLDKESLVVDVGSNDGTFLKNFYNKNIRVLGIDPAENIVKIALKKDIDTVNDIFCLRVAQEINQIYGKADLITANNVFAHISNIREIVEAVTFLLKDNGTFVFEVSYAPDIINKNLFDTIYHEHLFYYCMTPLIKLFEEFYLEIFDFDKISSKGGSIRVYVKRKSTVPVVKKLGILLRQEEYFGFQSSELYKTFNNEIEIQKQKTLNYFDRAFNKNEMIVGYGASATVTTLVNTFQLDKYFDYLVDDNVIKHGSYLPGTSLVVKSKDKLIDDSPSAICVLAWNYSSQIIDGNKHYSNNGGTFIVPMPSLEII